MNCECKPRLISIDSNGKETTDPAKVVAYAMHPNDRPKHRGCGPKKKRGRK